MRKINTKQWSVQFLTMLTTCLLIFLIASCSSSFYKSKPQITHVLAVTKEGDTLKIPINSIKPNVIYNVIGYDYYRPYNHNYYWRPYNHNYNNHKPINNGNSNYNNNSSNNTPVNTTPTVKPAGSVTPPPPPINPRKN